MGAVLLVAGALSAQAPSPQTAEQIAAELGSADAAAARDRLLARRRELHAALARRSAFTADDLTRCTIGEIEVFDARPDTTKLLPTLPPRGR